MLGSGSQDVSLLCVPYLFERALLHCWKELLKEQFVRKHSINNLMLTS